MKELFASETLAKLLTVFLLHPEREYYQRQLVGLVQGSLYLVQRELRRLEQAGLVERRPHGRQVFYRAVRRHPAFDDLRNAFLKTVALGDSLRDSASGLAAKVRLAFVFGSVANGSDSAMSDIDVAVVGSAPSSEVMAVFSEAGSRLGREINTVVFGVDEFVDKARGGQHFVNELLQAPKIWLIGDDDELRRLVE